MNSYTWMAVVCLLSLAAAAMGTPIAKAPPALYKVKNTAELLTAIAKVGDAGATIELEPGVYAIDKTIELNGVNHLNLRGGGWNTVIQKKGAGDALVFVDCGFCVVRDLMVSGDGTAKKGSGIVFKGKRGSSSCTVELCRVSGFPESGVLFEGSADSPQSSNSVRNCHFISNMGDQLRSFNNNDFYFIGNQFGTHSGNPRTGCVLDHSSAGTYSMNYHWGNQVAMRLGPGSHYNRIENNRFEESQQTGVEIGDAKGDSCIYNIITGNTFHTNSQSKSGEYSAVQAVNASSTTFCQNQLFSWNGLKFKHKSGLVIGLGCTHWIVTNNILRDSVQKSLVFDETAGHIIKDNITE